MTEDQEERLTLEEMVREWVKFYKIPLIFGLVGAVLISISLILWQSNRQSDKIIFTQEASESASVNQRIKADIEGAIAKPGVYELNFGSRIQDLLIMAGGLSAEADREWISKNLNLAAKLNDGGKVYVPKVGEKNTTNPLAGGLNTTNAQININIASVGDLDQLPGIGPVTAQKIIDNRPYQTIDELLSRKVVNKSTFEKIKDKINAF